VLPGPIRRALGPIASRVGALGVARTLRKYGTHRDGGEAQRGVVVSALDEIRATLAKAPAGEAPQTLLGRFTFADVAMAQVIVNLELPASGMKVGAASRRSFVDPALRALYADLVVWRDELYRAFRTPAA
jgi:glutathione S-transferase